MTVQRENFEVAATEVVQEAESVLEGTPVTPQPEPTPVPSPPPATTPKPPVTPQCCGRPPGPMMLMGTADSGGDVEHDPSCENHPDNLAKQEVAS
ncbi:hypothetical protein SK854_25820 [Lentzea sp. BCCO 10_0061]|uniref:Uncharacterized protein n=1 Tax=Lentzea sokolovensis TaxID=3095429 RepID=A0ABU4V1A1_9PSEU|nr:hypothetical protein [Lentzea sp. BCCO 10_0061]MDX8145553.1 hypothetical protein [Lentzea sp. BCCO 10_0061]